MILTKELKMSKEVKTVVKQLKDAGLGSAGLYYGPKGVEGVRVKLTDMKKLLREEVSDAKEVVATLKENGVGSAGIFYGAKGPEGVKVKMCDIEKFMELL